MTRKETLDAAMQAVCTNRENQYGPPEDTFAVIAEYWEVYLRTKCVGIGSDVCLCADDVAAMMALLKMGRITCGRTHDDNFVDLAGYAACAAELGGDRG